MQLLQHWQEQLQLPIQRGLLLLASEPQEWERQQRMVQQSQGLELLKSKRKAVSEFAIQYKEVKEEISELKQTVGTQGPAATIQQNKLDAQLVELEIRALRITRDYAQSLLEFENIIGTDIDEL